MIPDSPVVAELHTLLDALCEESITPEQVRRLEELVLAHPEAEAYYVRYMGFYADLVRTVAGLPARAEQLVRDRADAPASPPEHASPAVSRGHRRRVVLVAAALAASALLAVVYFARPRSVPQGPRELAAERTDDTVAVLIQSHRAVWDETGLPTRPGSPLAPGRLVLKAGFAQIEFYNGATVILEGPAEFRLVSRTEGYCSHGKLRATVPPQANGFRIGSPALNVVDRGTEFGMNVGEKTAVHVFQGEVHLFDPGAEPASAPHTQLKTGDAVSMAAPGNMSKIDPTPAEFLTAGELSDRTAKEIALRQEEWRRASAERRADPDLLVYYAFGGDDANTRTLLDASRGRNEPRDGALVGCAWGNGRWRGRQGVEFKRMSDRVRLNVPGEYRSLTFAAWVRPDALPNVNNSLLMSDGWEEGECHWQIGSDGTVILGIKGPPDYKPEPNVRGPQYRAYGAITPEMFGRWVHLAVVYDRQRGEVTHFVDGQVVARSEILLNLDLRIGAAELGNWNPDGYRVKTPIRNFTGCIDEFTLFRKALRPDEIEQLCAQGRPPL